MAPQKLFQSCSSHSLSLSCSLSLFFLFVVECLLLLPLSIDSLKMLREELSSDVLWYFSTRHGQLP